VREPPRPERALVLYEEAQAAGIVPRFSLSGPCVIDLRPLPPAAAEVCVLALLGPHGEEKIFEGECRGRIGRTLAGGGGFGYDPVFFPDGFDKTFAELGDDVKNKISHRGTALKKLFNWLRVL
jgi:inosine/xanthosine triphosphate pyrophosphatase family protein